jgi:hypothetical protein
VDDLWKFWHSLDAETSAAIIGAAATLLAATIGALLVIWQIGRQANHAIQQNQHNEAVKLKLQIYEEANHLLGTVTERWVDLSSYVRQFGSDLWLYEEARKQGVSWPLPKARAPLLNEKQYSLHSAATRLIGFTERWAIIDPRLDLFWLAINVSLHDAMNRFQDYFNLAHKLMPVDPPTASAQDFPFPWQPPTPSQQQELKTLQEAYDDALMILETYTADLAVELQLLLVGELFNRDTIKRREPIDPRHKVIRLDRYEELKSYLENETAWGRYKTEGEARVRANIQAKAKQTG